MTTTMELGAATRSTKRKNTTKACEECRRRRAKCDGWQPSCSRCLERGILCRYSNKADGRQPAPKSYVVLLRGRIEMLEAVLRANNIDVEQSIRQLKQDNNNNHNATHAAEGTATVSTEGSAAMDDLSEALKGALTLDESLNFDQDGEIRYFGPTSGRLRFRQDTGRCDAQPPQSSAEPEEPPPSLSDISRQGLNQLYQSVTGHDHLQDPLVNHLVDLYFRWENPWNPVVNEKLFRQSWRENGRYFSPLLLNAILACGSRYSDYFETRTDHGDPNTAGTQFLEKAEALLYHELKWPNITTIQSLSILSVVYTAFGTDAAGWLHHGMCIRLAQDMGLNKEPELLSGSVMLSQEDIELRRQIYWSLYCHDKMFAGYTGRVCTVLDSQMLLKLPGSQRIHSRAEMEEAVSYKDDMNIVNLAALSSLCRISEDVLQSLWAPKPLMNKDKRINFFNDCSLRLKSWFYDLPAQLRIDRRNDFPQAYTLHMMYHTICILLARPFLHSENTTTTPHPLQSGQEMRQKATDVCLTSSKAVVAAARSYRREFGSFRLSPVTATFSTLSAALVFYDVYREHGTCWSDLELCVQVLGELSTTWDPARRYQREMSRLLNQTSAAREVGESSTSGVESSGATNAAGVSVSDSGEMNNEDRINGTIFPMYDPTVGPYSLTTDYLFLDEDIGLQYGMIDPTLPLG